MTLTDAFRTDARLLTLLFRFESVSVAFTATVPKSNTLALLVIEGPHIDIFAATTRILLQFAYG